MTPAEKTGPTLAGRLRHREVLGRIVLTTDGTVTPLLEHIVDEPVVAARIDQHYVDPDDRTRALLQVSACERLLSRSTELVGARSGAVYVQARSIAVPRALPQELRHGLLRTGEPIGAMLRRQRIETFREILAYALDGERPDRWACREYRIFIGGTPALLISEVFGTSCLHQF
ncbi:chorismate--pyruvate lyase family protein [Sphaerisporangium rhizosphaerae]|uniref:Chorismate--pyruvate lyase family protein n=1 Tax=Sphaerisporangium rhizosphaerae TaxID=2269375 RepID=A0ABW2PHJ0_9ACTN